MSDVTSNVRQCFYSGRPASTHLLNPSRLNLTAQANLFGGVISADGKVPIRHDTMKMISHQDTPSAGATMNPSTPNADRGPSTRIGNPVLGGSHQMSSSQVE